MAAYRVIPDRVSYRDLGPDDFDRLASEPLTRHYVQRLAQFGHHVHLHPAA